MRGRRGEERNCVGRADGCERDSHQERLRRDRWSRRSRRTRRAPSVLRLPRRASQAPAHDERDRVDVAPPSGCGNARPRDPAAATRERWPTNCSTPPRSVGAGSTATNSSRSSEPARHSSTDTYKNEATPTPTPPEPKRRRPRPSTTLDNKADVRGVVCRIASLGGATALRRPARRRAAGGSTAYRRSRSARSRRWRCRA